MEITQEQKNYAKYLYLSGKTYREVQELTGILTYKLAEWFNGLKKRSDIIISEESRQKMRENGFNALKRNNKFWTKPEREFREILNNIGIGVKFPNYVKEKFDLTDDENPEVSFQFPIEGYVGDFVDQSRKIIYCINGDFWHANPLLYPEKDKPYPVQLHNIKKDKNRINFLKIKGWESVVIWEREIYHAKDIVKYKILTSRNILQESIPNLEDWSEKLKNIWSKERNTRIAIEKQCRFCNKTFNTKNKKMIYCSSSCFSNSNHRVIRPSKEELQKLLWEIPTTHIAEKYNVSDKAIHKWAISYGLDKPPRGYWTKLKFQA